MSEDHEEVKTVTDPVCGMQIEKRDLKTSFRMVTYYFCSASCKEKFEEDPEKFTG